MAVLETLTRRSALTLATSHLGALKTLATRVQGVVNGSLEFDGTSLSPTYRFTKGIPGRSYGLAIARRLGVDRDVIALAESLVPEAERELDRLLAAVEARRQSLEQREVQLGERLAVLESREAVVARTQATQSERESQLRLAEKTAVRDRARQAKAYLLEARKRVEEALGMARGAADEAAAKEARRLVEDGIRIERQRTDDREERDAAAPGTIVVGDAVRLNTGATGEVVQLRGDGKAVVLVGTMRLVIATSTLTPVPRGTLAAKSHAAIAVDTPAHDAVYEIDLRGMRADEAEAVVASAIDQAVLAEQPHLAIIHGMGTGVLRDTVRSLLAADGRVASFDFAPRHQGGIGVTIAVLR
jgi:DNA mismatch repair protein MutS2